jgi:hypothetical protein
MHSTKLNELEEDATPLSRPRPYNVVAVLESISYVTNNQETLFKNEPVGGQTQQYKYTREVSDPFVERLFLVE